MMFLAEAVVQETGVSGELLIKIIGALFSGILLLMGGRAIGKKEAQGVTLQNPVPEIPFRKVSNPVSYDQHSALDARVARIETHLDRIERDQSLQYKQILEAGAERELRMTEVMNLGLRAVHERLDEILTHRPPSRR
jgi:hypothetical protein